MSTAPSSDARDPSMGTREPSAHPVHPKLDRECYRGHLQTQLAARLAGEGHDSRHVRLVGDCLVDMDTGEILDAAPGEHPELYLSAMHSLAADPSNRWVGYRQASDCRGEAESVPLGGSTWEVSDRADPSYQARLRNRGRREIFKALDRGWARLRAAKPTTSRSYRERFVTLTAPSQNPTTRLQEWATHNRALGKLRETEFFAKRVWGGVKNLEDPGMDRPHVHSHSIWIALYMPQTALAWVWTQCALEAAEEQSGQCLPDPRQDLLGEGWTLERVLEVETQAATAKKKLKQASTLESNAYWQGKLDEASATLQALRRPCFVVDVQLVGKTTSATTVERQTAILELCKYVTKTTDLLERSQEDLLGLLLPSRAPRVFDTFGACRGTKEQKDEIQEALKAVAKGAENRANASLDQAAIKSETAGSEHDPKAGEEGTETPKTGPEPPPKKKRPPSWRKLMQVLPLSDFIHAMRLRAASNSAFALGRLKQCGIFAWTLAEVLELGECPDPFVTA